MRLYSAEGLWAIARFWYTFFGLLLLVILGNAFMHGFGELRDVVQRMRPMGWLLIVAAIAPGPVAHWFSRRVKE